MSVSLLEVLESAGYDLSTKEDCLWLESKQSEFERLVEDAEKTIYQIEEAEFEDEPEL